MSPSRQPHERLTAAPIRRLAVLTCMDARIEPVALLGLELGDAHVIRNAGGLATDDAIRSLALSQHLLETRDIAVIQHTGCGLLTTTDDDVAARMRQHAGHEPEWRAGCFTDLERSVRDAVATLAECEFLIPGGSVHGHIYDVATGRLHDVV